MLIANTIGSPIPPFLISAPKGAPTKNKTKEFNLPMGIHVVEPDPEKLRNKITEGYRFLAYGIDSVFLSNKAEIPRFDLENKK